MTKLKGTENMTGFLDWDMSISWPEAKDNAFGPGIYSGPCLSCGKVFLGYKNRRYCINCYVEPKRSEVCEHGRLKRQCNECDMQDEIDTLTEQNKELVETLDEFDRYQGNDNDYLNSPFCAKVRELLFKHGACQEDERPKLKEHEIIAKHRESDK